MENKLNKDMELDMTEIPKGVVYIGKQCCWCSKDITHRNDWENGIISHKSCEECDEKFKKCPKCGSKWEMFIESNFRQSLSCTNCGEMSRDIVTGDIIFEKFDYVTEIFSKNKR